MSDTEILSGSTDHTFNFLTAYMTTNSHSGENLAVSELRLVSAKFLFTLGEMMTALHANYYANPRRDQAHALGEEARWTADEQSGKHHAPSGGKLRRLACAETDHSSSSTFPLLLESSASAPIAPSVFFLYYFFFFRGHNIRNPIPSSSPGA